MKTIDKMSRLTGMLEKLFRMLNEDLFNNDLPSPVITVTPSSRSYAHYTPWDAWTAGETPKREINIASGTLDRPLENIVASLVHEMCHMANDLLLNVQDCSRGGTYHNKHFKSMAEAHGLTVTRSDKYGWAHTAPANVLLDWILKHDELKEVEMCRHAPGLALVGVGAHAGSMTGITPVGGSTTNHSRKYQCPCCKNSVRATKQVNVICGDCMVTMI